MDYFAGDMPSKSAKTLIALTGGTQPNIYINQADYVVSRMILK